MPKVLFIAVAGGSGSGKSALTERLRKAFGPSLAAVYCDNYYKRRPEKTLEERSRVNYDHPDAVDSDLLIAHLRALAAGQAVDCPLYDYTDHNRSEQTVRIKSARLVAVDGLFVLADERIRNLCDIKVFVETDEATRLRRRTLRDERERGRTAESVRRQFYDTVKPMHDEFIEPSKAFADIVFHGGAYDEASYQILLTMIKRQEEGS